MKFFKRIMSIALASIMLLGVMTGCDCKGCNDNPDDTTGETPVNEIIEGEYLLKSLKSDYKIVLPADAEQYETVASEEFNFFFEKATGVTIPVVKDTGLDFTDDSKYISLGANEVQKKSGVECPTSEYLNRDGYVIKTVGKSIFILAGADTGVLFGVYGLLNDIIDYECYGLDNYYYETNVANIPLKNYSIEDIPDILERVPRHGTTQQYPTSTMRLKMRLRNNVMSIGGTSHSSMYYLPKATYLNSACSVQHADGEECFNDCTDSSKTIADFPSCHADNYHPEWYMLGGNPTQLCYTARGNAEDYEAMQNACLNTLIGYLKSDTTSNYAAFGMSDDNNWCTCDACQAALNKYGAPSGQVIVFLNDLIEKVYDWFDTQEGQPYKRDFYFYFFAYMTLEGAPVVKNEDGTYSPSSPDVVCNEKVIPYVALTAANYTQTLSGGEKNKTALENIKGWSACSDKIWVWTYVANYRAYLLPLDTFGVTQDWYQTYMKYANVMFFQAQGKSSDTSMSTGFIGLQTYLDAKLAWDVNADVNTLIKNYFKATYRDAADIIYEIFEEYRTLSKYNEMNIDGWLTSAINQGSQLLNEKFWPKNLLVKWAAKFDDALAAIENIKNYDSALYEQTLKFVRSERVWVNYAYYKLYGNTLSSAELKELKATLLSDIEFCAIGEITEANSIASFKTELAS